jgi:hypothetical protein
LHTDWHRYETPAVVRKHGRQFLERIWSNMEGHSHPSGFERVIRHYGAEASESGGITLVSFQDGGCALDCAERLRELDDTESVQVLLRVNRRLP